MDIQLKNITLSYAGKPVFRELNVDIPRGKITCIMGPSGCGKTSLLNLINETRKPDSGVIETNGAILSQIFQETRLLPWKTAQENVEVFLKQAYGRKKRQEVAATYLETMGLSEFLEFYPHQLSGGMKQRVSIARAFSFPGNTILMDEPFTGLDIQLRTKLVDDFKTMWEKDQRTVVYVTHNIEEVLTLGYQVVIMSERPQGIRNIFHSNSMSREQLHASITGIIEEKNEKDEP